MIMTGAALMCWFVVLLLLSPRISAHDAHSPNIEDPGRKTRKSAHNDKAKEVCGRECSDRLGFDAIRALHSQLDDDANGNIDIDESAGFIREELHYEGGSETRQQEFHRDDHHISVRDLWEGWLQSEVHNWTVEDTVHWLTNNVDLPQYEANFIEHQVDGLAIPRLASTSFNYMSATLGIKDPIHRQKLALKAMDVVLFGAPKERRALWKDVLIVGLLTFAIAGGYAAVKQYKYNVLLNEKMNRDIARREKDLQQMQQELERATMARDSSPSLDISNNLEFADSRDSHEELSRLRAELEVLRGALAHSEEKLRLKEGSWIAPQMLQHWLQLTYEIETHYFNSKKQSADAQIATAREACEKLKKKRSSLVGAFVTTHGRQAEAVDLTIQQARKALREVTKDLQERTYRWKQVENLCGCYIRVNPGLPYLQTLLTSRLIGDEESMVGRYGGSQEFIEDDSDSVSAVKKLVSCSAITFATPPAGSLTGVPPSRELWSNHADVRRVLRPLHDSGTSTCGSIQHSRTASSLASPRDVIPEIPRCVSQSTVSRPPLCRDPSKDSSDSSPSSSEESSAAGKPTFVVGESGEGDSEARPGGRLSPTRSDITSNRVTTRKATPFIKSHSQDTYSNTTEAQAPSKPKSQSESELLNKHISSARKKNLSPCQSEEGDSDNASLTSEHSIKVKKRGGLFSKLRHSKK